jgi:hypothetical protein
MTAGEIEVRELLDAADFDLCISFTGAARG